jgi:hypothetical protein
VKKVLGIIVGLSKDKGGRRTGKEEGQDRGLSIEKIGDYSL